MKSFLIVRGKSENKIHQLDCVKYAICTNEITRILK